MKRIIIRILIAVFAVVFLVSAGMLIKHYADDRNQTEEFTKLSDFVREYPNTLDETPDETDEPSRLMAYRELYEQNNDLAGWLRIEGTSIDYPVMHTPSDSEYYLKRDFNKAYSSHGTPFLDAACDPEKPSTVLTIYGHHIKNGKMFGALKEYESQKYYEQHFAIQFDTLNEIGDYEIVAVFKSQVYTTDPNVFQYYLYTDFEDEEPFDAFMARVNELRLYDTGKTAGYGDRLLMLSTCEYSRTNGRLVILARKI